MVARWIVPVVLTVSFFPSCRMANLGKDYPESTAVTGTGDASSPKPPVLQPQRQSQLGGVLPLTIDDEGKVKEQLVLRLDYFPAPRPDGVSVPTCYQEISAGLVVGRVKCDSDANLSADVTASQVNQQCYTSTPARKIAARSAITLVGCKGTAQFQIFRFEPDLKIEIVK